MDTGSSAAAATAATAAASVADSASDCTLLQKTAPPELVCQLIRKANHERLHCAGELAARGSSLMTLECFLRHLLRQQRLFENPSPLFVFT